MDEHDSTERARRRKPNRPRPVLRRGELYLVADILELLGTTKRTLADWKAAGLRTMKPGTKAEYVMTDDLLDFFGSWKGE